jgi:hypothetical protein
MNYEQVLAAALKLDAGDRANLAELLWITVGHQEEGLSTWVAGAERRVEIDGEQEVLSPDEILRELRSRYAK